MTLAIIVVLKAAITPPPVVVIIMVLVQNEKVIIKSRLIKNKIIEVMVERKSKPRAASSKIDSPPEEILLIGDSMLRNIDPDGYKQAVWLFSYPGINASQVWFLKFRQLRNH